MARKVGVTKFELVSKNTFAVKYCEVEKYRGVITSVYKASKDARIKLKAVQMIEFNNLNTDLQRKYYLSKFL